MYLQTYLFNTLHLNSSHRPPRQRELGSLPQDSRARGPSLCRQAGAELTKHYEETPAFERKMGRLPEKDSTQISNKYEKMLASRYRHWRISLRLTD